MKESDDLKLEKEIEVAIKKVLIAAIELSKAQSAINFCSNPQLLEDVKSLPTFQNKES